MKIGDKVIKDELKIIEFLAPLDYESVGAASKSLLDDLLTLALRSVELGEKDEFLKFFDENIDTIRNIEI